MRHMAHPLIAAVFFYFLFMGKLGGVVSMPLKPTFFCLLNNISGMCCLVTKGPAVLHGWLPRSGSIWRQQEVGRWDVRDPSSPKEPSIQQGHGGGIENSKQQRVHSLHKTELETIPCTGYKTLRVGREFCFHVLCLSEECSSHPRSDFQLWLHY